MENSLLRFGCLAGRGGWQRRRLWVTAVGALALGAMDVSGREFRVSQIPNGNVLRCANCHVSPAGGGPRNPFGLDVEAIVRGPSPIPFWSATLAAKDSDRDGFSNGTELGDPDGDGVPIAGWKATNPGNAASKPANVAPTVSIAAPANDATLTAPAVVSVEVTAADTDGTVAVVELFDGGQLLGTDTAAPYAVVADLGVGVHVLTAKATDNLGAATTSAAVNVTVSAPPPVTLSQPALTGGTLEIAWTGGGGPFLVETKPALDQPWGTGVRGTSARTIQIPAEGLAGFLRVADTAVMGPVALAASLSGANERPTPVDTAGTGSGTFTLQGSTLSFSITYSGLSGPATAGHIHGPAGPEQTASPLIDLAPFNGGSFGASGTIAGSLILSAEQKAALLTGQTYVNIHTATFGGGEIRGQIVR